MDAAKRLDPISPVLTGGIDQSSLASLSALLAQAQTLLDKLMAALSVGLSELSSAQSSLQSAVIEKQFAEIRQQMEAAGKNIFLKIFMPILMLFGIFSVLAAPIDPITKTVLVSLLLAFTLDSMVGAATGEGFLKPLFEKIAAGNEEVAKWLMVGIEAMILLASFVATMGSSAGNFATRMAALPAKVQSFFTMLSRVGVQIGDQALETTRNLVSALGKLTEAQRKKLASKLDSALHSTQSGSSPIIECLTELSKSPVVDFVRKGLSAPNAMENFQKLCDVVMYLSGIVVGSMSIDKALFEMRLASVTKERDHLEALAAVLKDYRKEFETSFEHMQDARIDIDADLGSAIHAWRN